MEAVDILRKTKEFLADPSRWHKGSASNKDHSAYCLIGAISLSPYWNGKCFNKYSVDDLIKHDLGSELSKALFTLKTLVPPEYYVKNILADFNDHPDVTHENIMNLIDQAILKLSQETAGSEPSVERELVAV